MTRVSSAYTFEERLKSLKLKRKKNLIIKLSIIISVFSLLAIYFFLPLSHASNTRVSGTKYYSTNQILQIANVNKADSLYMLSEQDIKRKLDEFPLLGDDSKVKITPFGMSIEVEEYYPTFKKINDGDFDYYFNTGELVDKSLLESTDENIGKFLVNNLENTILVDFSLDIASISKKVYKTLVSIVSKISIENRAIIDHISYLKQTNTMSIYYEIPSVKAGMEKTYVKLVFCINATIYEDGIHHVLTKEQIDKRIEDIKKNNISPTLEGENNVYAWEVILEENTNHYFAKFVEIKEVTNE